MQQQQQQKNLSGVRKLLKNILQILAENRVMFVCFCDEQDIVRCPDDFSSEVTFLKVGIKPVVCWWSCCALPNFRSIFAGHKTPDSRFFYNKILKKFQNSRKTLCTLFGLRCHEHLCKYGENGTKRIIEGRAESPFHWGAFYFMCSDTGHQYLSNSWFFSLVLCTLRCSVA